MAVRRLETFSLLEDEESDDINVLVEKLGKRKASRDTGVEKIKLKKRMNSEPEKEKPLAEIEKTSLMEDNNGYDHGWKSGRGRRRKRRSSIGRSKVGSTENSDQDHEYDSHEVEENSVSLISRENGKEDAEENGDEEIGEEGIEENSKTGGKRRGRRNKSKSKKVVQNEGVFARLVKLTAAGLCFLVFALSFIAIAMS